MSEYMCFVVSYLTAYPLRSISASCLLSLGESSQDKDLYHTYQVKNVDDVAACRGAWGSHNLKNVDDVSCIGLLLRVPTVLIGLSANTS